jgi:WD40 repeat protein
MARYIELPTNESITGLAWSGQYLAATSLTGIRLYDMLALQQPPRLFQVPNGPTYTAAFNPAGTLMVSVHNDTTVRLWDIAIGGLRGVLRDHTQPVRAVAFSPSGLVIASAGGNEITGADSAIRLWNITNQSLSATLEGHSGAVTALAFSPDGSMLASAGLDQTVRLWDVASAAPGTIMEGHAEPVRAVIFNPDGTWLASAGDDGTIQLWEIGEGTPLILEGHTGGVRALAFSPSLLISAGAEDGAIRFWDIAMQTQAVELTRDDYGGGADSVITGLVLHADGVMLAFATAEGEPDEPGMIRIWGVEP